MVDSHKLFSKDFHSITPLITLPCTSKQTRSFIPTHLCQEFRKEVQNQLPLKSKVMSVGKQLMANRNYDTRGLDTRLEAIEEEWNQLEHSISTAEQSLHQAQMELMPSRQALHELQVWMDEIEKALDADANSPIKTLADIEVMLKKYKVSES